MPLETGTTISSLNASNPAATDGLGQADDHMRLIKSVLKTTFPNFAGVLSATEAKLDAVVSSMYVGTMHSFPKARADIKSGGGSGLTGYNFLECDGGSYLIADFPALGAYLGSTYGGNGTTTFNVPSLSDTGRFIRSRTGAVAVGTSQANVFKTHTHDTIGSTAAASADHTHTFSGTTAGQSNSHTHGYSQPAGVSVQVAPSAGVFVPQAPSAGTTDPNSLDHSHTYSGTTSGFSANHTHAISLTSTASTPAGSTETRPEAFSAIIAIKT